MNSLPSPITNVGDVTYLELVPLDTAAKLSHPSPF